jgi:Cytochrome c peroxidase
MPHRAQCRIQYVAILGRTRTGSGSQSKQPLINPVEYGLTDHKQVLEIVRTDPNYLADFQSIFEVSGKRLTIDHVAQAIASFERTLIAGNSAFDRYYFNGKTDAMSEAQIRGFQLFTDLTTYQFLITSQNAGKGRSFCKQRMRRRNPRLNKETKLR